MSRFGSILWPAGDAVGAAVDARTITDLNLDEIFTIIARADPTLARYLRSPVADLDTVLFRQEIFRDLARAELRELYTNSRRSCGSCARSLPRRPNNSTGTRNTGCISTPCSVTAAP
ncbi:hypothetical protein F5X71_13595 [Nocardia brasiliensis]|uniref:Uncharacterized protein n=1 Tax=Nocardia brasiliensis TaxID=37326 RepID=A0A6G9XQM3_NOCBR|nr:hypothetical protein [Nocardia brasiliensis]QIS03206.1 hypothetical protein F5X71_13595 [Nocardia brasiliensis]